MCVCILQYLKIDYKLKNVRQSKPFCLKLNKTVSKASDISLLNEMVFLLQAFIIHMTL
jgi:hypothetical protein